MKDWIYLEYFDNIVLDYLIALGIIIVGAIAVRIFRTVVIRKLIAWSERTRTTADNFIFDGIQRFGIPALYYFATYQGISYLNLSPKVQRVLEVVTAVVVTFLTLRLVSSTIVLLLKNYIGKQENGVEKMNQLGGLIILINIVIWAIGFVFLVDNLGYDATTIIAGLGIGGIAIALAAQNILGDLFNYFVIFFDRPFEIGDAIVVDDKIGTVEYIGIKTTRIRSITGEQIIIGNSNLTAARIHNFKRLMRRRILFTIDVEYGTPLERLKQIPSLLKTIIENQQNVTFDRAHFARYNEWSFRFEIVYYVLVSDYITFMDIQQAINFQIYEEFIKAGVGFAYPTQNLFIRPNTNADAPENLIPPKQAPERVSEERRRPEKSPI